jgi:hypothetical protein
VNRELQKQLKCYKEELEVIKTEDETYELVENYEKVATDFNALYSHYKAQK